MCKGKPVSNLDIGLLASESIAQDYNAPGNPGLAGNNRVQRRIVYVFDVQFSIFILYISFMEKYMHNELHSRLKDSANMTLHF